MGSLIRSWQHNVLLQVLGDRLPQVLAPQPLVGEETVSIAVRTVTENRDDRAALAQLLSNFLSSHDVERGASAQVQTLLIQAAVHHLDGLLITDVQGSVEKVNVRLEVVSNTALSDTLRNTAAGALDQLSTALDVAVEHTAWRISQEALDPAIADGLQVSRDTCQGTGRSRGASEGVDLSLRLGPNLWTGGLDVRLTVGRVVELVRPDGVIERLRVSSGLVVVVLWVVERHCGDWVHLRAQQAEQINLSLGLGVGHVDDQLVALGAADVR